MEFLLGAVFGMALAGSLTKKSRMEQRQQKREWRELAIQAGLYRRSRELA